uniref:Uncharacterized protein n=1 Tax=Oryza punctata TaxID=4537 RepID=A0A0E0KNL2_ORYPU
MALYRRLLHLRRLPHFHPPATLASSAASATPRLSPLLTPSRPFASSSSIPRVVPSGLARDGSFGRRGDRKFFSTVGAVLVGQAAIFLGVCNESALAQDDSAGLGATRNEQAEENTTGLQRIEDGSVISNEHTVKWRIFTDNARDFLLKASNSTTVLLDSPERNLDEAEKLFQAALHEAIEGFGLRDPHVASALNNLAEFYRLKKEYEKAELLYLEAIEILEESFGSDDIRVGTALHSLGICYHLQRKFALAQTCYERALKIEGRVMGIGHPEYASTMYLLGKVLSQQGKDAEALIEESIRILEESGLGESPTCIQRMRCLEVRKRILSEEHFQVAVTLVHLARLTMLNFISDKEDIDLARSKLVRARLLLQAFEVAGLLESGMKNMLAPGEQDLYPVEQALNKCVSLYKEPHTRKLVSKTLKNEYIRCLRRLTGIVQSNFAVSEALTLQGLLAEAQQILEELGDENN